MSNTSINNTDNTTPTPAAQQPRANRPWIKWVIIAVCIAICIALAVVAAISVPGILPRVINIPVFDKPIIYFYPETDTVIDVRLDLDGDLTCSYPLYGEDGWNGFTAHPDGTLTGPDGREYYALYWEGRVNAGFDMSRGFCIEGSRTAEFLEKILPRLGLTAREAEEFIVYWLPRMQGSAYNLITFQTDAYTDSARLTVDPEPDTLIRVFMVWQSLDQPVEIPPQEIATPERIGFTVVEWGGSEIRTGR